MENFVAELEAQRVAELEAYLAITGLKDYNLTFEEEKVLKEYNSIEFSYFNIIDIFDIKNTKNILSREITNNNGKTPYLCASAENNGVSSYINYKEEYLESGNCIFIGGKTFVVTYQENDFYSNDSHNLALYLKEIGKKKKFNQLGLVTCINKSLNHKYSWGNSISKTKIQNDKILLPEKNGKPNFEFIEKFISAIQKLVIKDVVIYLDTKLQITKEVVAKTQ